eukprot:COSAG06_NODE_1574_length_9058_cov_6.883692_4_plen_312_part_00
MPVNLKGWSKSLVQQSAGLARCDNVVPAGIMSGQDESVGKEGIEEPLPAYETEQVAGGPAMGNFVLESEEEDAEEEYFNEVDCPGLVSCGHSEQAKEFRAKAPEPIRFGCSSFLGSLSMFVLNELAMLMMPEDWFPNPGITIAWAVSYAASICPQHWFHATLVYGWKMSYREGLMTTYAGYGVSYVASLPINEGLVLVGCNAQQAWALTLFLTGCVNYFLFQRLLGGSKKPPATPRGMYNPPDRTTNSANPLSEGMLDPEQQREVDGDGNPVSPADGTGRQMAAEYRRLQAEQGTTKTSPLDRFYVWVAGW